MLVQTEQKLLSYVPKKLKDLYPRIVMEYMADVHEDFNKIIKAFSLQKILRPAPNDFIPQRTSFAFSRPGRTSNYRQFQRNREKLKNILMITYPFIRSIILYSNLDFPDILNDYSLYREGENAQTTLDDFEAATTKDLNSNSIFIKKVWYPKIVRIIKRVYQRRTLVPQNLWPRIVACASGLIIRQIIDIKIRTICNLHEVILNREKIPYFKINLVCYKEVNLEPMIDRIKDVFHMIVDEISSIHSSLPELGDQIDSSLRNPLRTILDTSIPSEYLNELHETLENNLNRAFNPIITYLHSFQDEYVGLYGPEMYDNITVFLTEEKTFEEFLEKVDEFKEYKSKLQSVVANVYFDNATVNQTNAVKSLKMVADEFIDRITINIVKSHKAENQQICRIFEGIKERALEIPRSTEQLLENGEWMLYVRTKQLFEIQTRIQDSLRVGGLLIELTELDDDHLAYQIATIRWFNSVKSVFDQNASLFEQYKTLFEEKLGEVTRKLNDDLNDMLPHLDIINDMCDHEKYNEYNLILINIKDRIAVFDDYVEWVNKEEKLFKFPKSQYITLDAIKEFVLPFDSLMKLCIQWLRYYYVWMDGPFEYLDPVFVAETVEFYSKEFNRLQKYYRNKIKADLVGAPICKFRVSIWAPIKGM